MKTIKKTICIIIIALAGMAFFSSCSKEQGKGGMKKEKKAPITARSPNERNNTLKAARDGQFVSLTWQTDATDGKIKQINIMRSSLGPNNQTKVAALGPNATNYKDCLPDENAYWYSVQLFTEDGKFPKIGPVRVERDSAGSANYIRIGDEYKENITRTDDLATLKWDFPEKDYKEIRILRYPRPVAELSWKEIQGPEAGYLVAVTVENKLQYTDVLPDANSDYWYWFQITLKSGAVVYKGPIKAEYN